MLYDSYADLEALLTSTASSWSRRASSGSEVALAESPRTPVSDEDIPAVLFSIASLLARYRRLYTGLHHARLAQDLGLRMGDLKLLELIVEFGALTAGQLKNLAGLSSGGTASAVDRLEKAGYVVRTKHVNDRRLVLLCPVPDKCHALSMPPAKLVRLLSGSRAAQAFDENLLSSVHLFLYEALRELKREAEAQMLSPAA